MDNLTEILELGIEAKRHQNFEIALDYLDKAAKIAPTDSRIYGNRFRVLIGLGEYEAALRNLSILVNFNQLENVVLSNQEARAIALQMGEKFKWNDKAIDLSKFNPMWIWLSLKNNPALLDFLYRADNLTFYIGHSYLGLNSQLLTLYGISQYDFENLNHALLGNPRGRDLRESKYASLFLIIGFMIGHMNINKNLKSKENIVKYFLNTNNLLELDINNYSQFTGKLSDVFNANDTETLLNTMVKGVAESIGDEFNTSIGMAEVLNLKTYDDNGSLPSWWGLPEPPLEDFKIFFLLSISIHEDGNGNVVSKNGNISKYTIEDVSNFIDRKLGLNEMIATNSFHNVGKETFRIIRWYSFE